MHTRSLSIRSFAVRAGMLTAALVLIPATVQAEEAPASTPPKAATNAAAEAPAPAPPEAPVAPPGPDKKSPEVSPAPIAAPLPPAPQSTVPTEPPRAWPMSAWIVGGVGGALLVTGSIAGIIALNKDAELDNLCPSGVCTPATAEQGVDLKDARDTAVIIADIGIVGGLAGVATAVYLVLDSRHPKASRPQTGKLQLVPTVSPSGAGLLGSLRF
jgi:hypothetical protein